MSIVKTGVAFAGAGLIVAATCNNNEEFQKQANDIGSGLTVVINGTATGGTDTGAEILHENGRTWVARDELFYHSRTFSNKVVGPTVPSRWRIQT